MNDENDETMRTRYQVSVTVNRWERRLIARHLTGGILWESREESEATEAEVRDFFRRFGLEVGWRVIEKRRELHPELETEEEGEVLALEADELGLPA